MIEELSFHSVYPLRVVLLAPTTVLPSHQLLLSMLRLVQRREEVWGKRNIPSNKNTPSLRLPTTKNSFWPSYGAPVFVPPSSCSVTQACIG